VTALLVAGCGLLGLLVGSFVNVLVYRVPRKESIIRPRSRCVSCGSQVRGLDNVPVVSWLLLRGRCRTCAERISPRYPVVELVTGLVFAALAARFGSDPALPAFLALATGLLAISAIDVEHFIIPNRIVYPTLFVSAGLLVVAGLVDGRWESLGRAAIGGAAAWGALLVIHLAQPRGMGFGDVRLAGLIGVFLGWIDLGHVLLGLFLSFLLASIVGILLIALKIRSRKDRVPFGPFLVAGAMVAILVGGPILQWYGVG
jgi:leader peptidase (prepilin peptidase)/N-methyltransferase